MSALGFSPDKLPSSLAGHIRVPVIRTETITRGDIVAVKRDEATYWQDDAPNWFGK